MKTNQKIAFLDRDGVINVDLGYVHKSDNLIFLPGVEIGLRQLLKTGFKNVFIKVFWILPMQKAKFSIASYPK